MTRWCPKCLTGKIDSIGMCRGCGSLPRDRVPVMVEPKPNKQRIIIDEDE